MKSILKTTATTLPNRHVTEGKIGREREKKRS
jgi:hypothetical protein